MFNASFILLLTVFLFSSPEENFITKNLSGEKVIHVIVDESGIISIGRDTVTSDELARYIQERLFKNYLGTGKMYDKILFSKANDNVPAIVAEVVLNEIIEGQKRALRELCVQKYENKYDNITKKQQAKLKKAFPVLFQQKFW